VIAVHIFGNVVDVAGIEALGVPVVEDAAQAAGSIGPDGRAGALGTLGVFSFYPSKNLGAFGDAGAITARDHEVAERIRMLRFHGSRDKVTYQEVGFNSRLDEMQAAVLRVMLPEVPHWAAHRHLAGAWYEEDLGDAVGLPVAAAGSAPAWHLYVVRHPQPERLAEALAREGIEARAYYRTPVHRQPAMERWGPHADLPGTDAAAASHLALPIGAAITREQVARVAAAVRGAA
jgi:dTDP-4-amino-4,6-dideoxygalactose transaminase